MKQRIRRVADKYADYGKVIFVCHGMVFRCLTYIEKMRPGEIIGFYTVGGRIHEDESSAKAVVRELYEEAGYHFKIDKLVFIQERFYKVENVRHHEVVFFYLMKEADIKLQNGINADQLNEKLYWIPIEKLKNINLVPAFLKTAVKNIPNEITHIVSYE